MSGATAINIASKFQNIDMLFSVCLFASNEATFLDYMRKVDIPEIIKE